MHFKRASHNIFRAAVGATIIFATLSVYAETTREQVIRDQNMGGAAAADRAVEEDRANRGVGVDGMVNDGVNLFNKIGDRAKQRDAAAAEKARAERVQFENELAKLKAAIANIPDEQKSSVPRREPLVKGDPKAGDNAYSILEYCIKNGSETNHFNDFDCRLSIAKWISGVSGQGVYKTDPKKGLNRLQELLDDDAKEMKDKEYSHGETFAPEILNYIGEIYYSGVESSESTVKKDIDDARDYFEQSIHHTGGILYLGGVFGRVDTDSIGFVVDSYYRLIEIHSLGLGVQKDTVKAQALANELVGRIDSESVLQSRPEWESVKTFVSPPLVAALAKAKGKLDAKEKLKAELTITSKNSQPNKVFQDCSDCPEMVELPLGSFDMGHETEQNQKPLHRVTFNQKFALGKTEITRGQFSEFVKATDYASEDACFGSGHGVFNWLNPEFQQDDTHPVTCITKIDAQAYVKWLSKKTGKVYLLPTEAQWEYACRAGVPNKFCGGDNVSEVAWYDNIGQTKNKRSDHTHSVAKKQANAWGLYDMSGNVSEWMADSYHDDYTDAPTDGTAWIDTSWLSDNKDGVMRGGGWANGDFEISSTERRKIPVDYPDNDQGFRVARTLP
jgi:formylglycine-generating enzyme required for sulfatase activity